MNMNQGSQKQTKKLLVPNIKELIEGNRMSHFLPFYYDFFLQELNFKDWIFHSVVICGPEIFKRDGMKKRG